MRTDQHSHSDVSQSNGYCCGACMVSVRPSFEWYGSQAKGSLGFQTACQVCTHMPECRNKNWHMQCRGRAICELYVQEAGAWGSNATASSSQTPTVSCIPNQAASASDPVFDNPTYQIMSTSNYSLSPALTLTILLEAWPINSYPMLCQLPQGSVLIISGTAYVMKASCICHAFVMNLARICR